MRPVQLVLNDTCVASDACYSSTGGSHESPATLRTELCGPFAARRLGTNRLRLCTAEGKHFPHVKRVVAFFGGGRV